MRSGHACHNPAIRGSVLIAWKDLGRNAATSPWASACGKLLHLVYAVLEDQSLPLTTNSIHLRTQPTLPPRPLPPPTPPSTAKPTRRTLNRHQPRCSRATSSRRATRVRRVKPATMPRRLAGNAAAVGHKRDVPAEEVVTTAAATACAPPPPCQAYAAGRPGRSPQGRFRLPASAGRDGTGPATTGAVAHPAWPGPATPWSLPDSRPAGRYAADFFGPSGQAPVPVLPRRLPRAQGNVLDLWAAVHKLPLYEAALHLAETFRLPRNREEEPVK